MSLKDLKIPIPEIPLEWDKRIRCGNTCVWNEGKDSEVRLDPPQRGLFAKRFEDGWYWVCGCVVCLGSKDWSYINCDEHNACITCGKKRHEAQTPHWGHPKGFECNECSEKERLEKKEAALARAKEVELDEWDCYREDKIICPVCFSEESCEEVHEHGDHEVECHICGAEFIVEVEYDPKYTSRLKGEQP